MPLLHQHCSLEAEVARQPRPWSQKIGEGVIVQHAEESLRRLAQRAAQNAAPLDPADTTFEADVALLMVGRNVSVQYIINPQLSGFFRLDKDHKSGFLCVNTVGDTSKPEASNAAADISEPRLIQLVRAGIGVPDIAVKITV
jgi:hypothetical protein